MAKTAQPRKSEGNTCSCRKKEDCPLSAECLVSEVGYQATVTTGDKKELSLIHISEPTRPY